MNKVKLIVGLFILMAVGIWGVKYFADKNVDVKTGNMENVSDSSYYTCPMHPQIHQDHAGECPICHMKLVQVKKTKDKIGAAAVGTPSTDKRSSVTATDEQMQLIGIQKTTVEVMNLNVRLPISGRILSSTTAVFQIYEKDLRHIKPGFKFIGESSSLVDESINGVITSIDSTVDPTSRTVRVVGNIQKGPKNLLSETSFSGFVLIELKEGLAIPESAVLHTGSGDLVYLFGAENRLTAKTVKLGLKTEGFYEILSGLKKGDIISSGPNFLLDSESKIRGAND